MCRLPERAKKEERLQGGSPVVERVGHPGFGHVKPELRNIVWLSASFNLGKKSIV